MFVLEQGVFVLVLAVWTLALMDRGGDMSRNRKGPGETRGPKPGMSLKS